MQVWEQEGSYIERLNERREVTAQIYIQTDEGVKANADLARAIFAAMKDRLPA